MKNKIFALFVLLTLTPASGAWAENIRVLDEQLDGSGRGYTVVHVWGSHQEMGYALGATFAEEMAESMDQMRELLGSYYQLARGTAGRLHWPEPELGAEMIGIVDGIHSVLPNADVDITDLQVINAMSDLPYTMCRSHSAWGRYVSAPVTTLSTRRFDYSAVIPAMYHHVIMAMEPDDGVNWVNVGWTGIQTVITAVNEYGTLVALHDLGRANASLSSPVTRSAAARAVLTGVGNRPPQEHAGWATDQIGGMQVMTDTFITYYVPEGLGGMFTCQSQVCRFLAPQDDFLHGEAIITTNSTTDGHSTPSGGEWLTRYYNEGGPKTLADHWDVTDSSFHRLSVAYRGRGDMTLWFDGTTRSGSTGRVELEWVDLFGAPTAPDGDADADVDADADADADADGDSEPVEDSGPITEDGSATDSGNSDSGQNQEDGGQGLDREKDGCSCHAPSPQSAGFLGFFQELLEAL